MELIGTGIKKLRLFILLTLLCLGISPVSAQTPGTVKWVLPLTCSDTSCPAIGYDETIYAGSFYGLAAINPDGTKKWNFNDSAGIDVTTSPTIGTDGSIYFGAIDYSTSNAKLYAIKPDGSKMWTHYIDNTVYGTPALGIDGTIYTTSAVGTLYAINPDGTMKWNFRSRWITYNSVAIDANGVIYWGTGEGKFYAFYPDKTIKWEYVTGSPVVTEAAIGRNGTIYVGSNDNVLHAINPDGSNKWKLSFSGSIVSSPVLWTDDTIFIGTSWPDYKFHAINPDGTSKWYATAGGTFYTPAIGIDGIIYVGCYSGVYAVDPAPSVEWEYLRTFMITSPIAISKSGVIYFGTEYGDLYAIYASSHGLLNSTWPKFQHNEQNIGRLDGIPIPVGGMCVLGTFALFVSWVVVRKIISVV